MILNYFRIVCHFILVCLVEMVILKCLEMKVEHIFLPIEQYTQGLLIDLSTEKNNINIIKSFIPNILSNFNITL